MSGNVRGATVRELATAAGRMAKTKTTELFFALREDHGGTYLAAWSSSISIRVGPMLGPKAPAALSPERGYGFDDFLAHVEGDSTPFRHLAMFKTTDTGDISYPTKWKRETDDEYTTRVSDWERRMGAVGALRAVAGWHVIEHPADPRYWTATDLELVIAQALALIPDAAAQDVSGARLDARSWTKAQPYRYELRVWGLQFDMNMLLPVIPEARRGCKCDRRRELSTWRGSVNFSSACR